MRTIVFLFVIGSLLACEKQEGTGVFSNSDLVATFWAVDTNAMSGTSIREDVFPVVRDAAYTPANALFLPDSARVFVFSKADGLLVYPATYMGVEVVNEDLAGAFFSMTYCPITQSALAWNRIMGADTLLFSASGLLYKENLVAYDLETRSLWSQMLLKGIHGEHVNRWPETFPLLETRFGVIKRHFPNAMIFNGNYAGDDAQRKSTATEAPDGGGNARETLYKMGERVFGIVQRQSVITVSYKSVEQDVSVQRVQNIWIVSSRANNFITAFRADTITLRPLQDEFPYILQDGQGRRYDVFGRPQIKGAADRLARPVAFSALWWAWADFYDSFVPADK